MPVPVLAREQDSAQALGSVRVLVLAWVLARVRVQGSEMAMG